jgi:Domain of unknown function (DUF4232)
MSRRIAAGLVGVVAVSGVAIVAGLAVLVALAALAAPAGASGPEPCATGGLQATFTAIPFSQGLGQIYYELTVTNHAASACRVALPGTVRLLSVSGRGLPTRASTHPSGSYSVTLAPGQWAQGQAKFSPDINGWGENARHCEPTAWQLRIATDGGTLLAPMDPTPVCEHGSMSFERLKPVAPAPACSPSSFAGTFKRDAPPYHGTVDYTLTLHNLGGRCYTNSYVGLQLLAAGGSPLPTSVTGGVVSPKVIGAHARVSAAATLDTKPGAGEPRSGPCEAAARTLSVTLAPATGALEIPLKPPRSACHRGAITLSGLFAD